MKKEEVKSEELRDVLCAMVGKWEFDDITDEELQSISGISVRGRKFSGKPTDVELGELAVLSNLEELMITEFDLDDSIAGVLAQFPRLKRLKFSQCDFKKCKTIMDESDLDMLTLSGCKNIGVDKLPKSSTLVLEGEKIPFGCLGLERVRHVKFKNCDVIGSHDMVDFNNLQDIRISNTRFYRVSSELDGLEEISSIKAAPNTRVIIDDEYDFDR